MRCSVVIPCHNGAELTRACIDSLLAQEDGWVPAEILLVDNASRDDTRHLHTMSPRVRVLPQDCNRGFAGGVNAGIRAAHEDLVLVLNNDTRAAANLLRELTNVLASHAAMGAVAPVSNHVKGHARIAVGNRGLTAEGRAGLQAELGQLPPLQDVSTLSGLCLLVARATFDEVGLFDERFGHGNYEDDDFCLRLRLHGYRLGIASRAFLHHEGHATFKSLGLDLRTEIGRRLVQFTEKWRSDPAGAAHLAALGGDVEQAGRAARSARQVYPRWSDADWHLGRWHAAQGDHRRAVEHFQALLRQSPHHADARLAMAQSQLQLGDDEGAAATLQRVVRDAPSSGQQASLFAIVGHHAYRGGRCDEALAAFTSALELTPDDATLHHWLGLCHLGARRPAEAAVHLERAAAAGIAIAVGSLGVCRAQLGDRRGAMADFARAAALLPESTLAHAHAAASPGRR